MGTDCLGVVAAMPQEIAPLLRRMPGHRREKAQGCNLYRFTCGENPVVLIESGMGEARAEAATITLIRVAAPRAILSFGFCGGVTPGLKVGDMVLAERVYSMERGGPAEAPRPDSVLGELILAASRESGAPLERGTFITAGGILDKRALAESLGRGIPFPVLEMETAAVLRQAAVAGIPAAAIRGVSDAADEELGFSIEEMCDAQLNVSPIRVLALLVAKPYLVPQLVRLAGHSRKAGVILAAGVERALQALSGRG
ncbi:MAG TPA: nucleoside phosphorylase [Geobacter sp.]|nr:nucleoside phosphorylase [Geobacter sp.]